MPSTTNHKHSFSVPSTPAHSNNVATSPSVTRSVKAERSNATPVTPQRFPRTNRNTFSPHTPVSVLSTPYTPLSLRSALSSNGSTLNTPGSALSFKKLSFSMSPEIITKKSLADIADNWRSRANQNGIKVSSAPDDPHYADDECTSLFCISVSLAHLLSPSVFFCPGLMMNPRIYALQQATVASRKQILPSLSQLKKVRIYV